MIHSPYHRRRVDWCATVGCTMCRSAPTKPRRRTTLWPIVATHASEKSSSLTIYSLYLPLSPFIFPLIFTFCKYLSRSHLCFVYILFWSISLAFLVFSVNLLTFFMQIHALCIVNLLNLEICTFFNRIMKIKRREFPFQRQSQILESDLIQSCPLSDSSLVISWLSNISGDICKYVN